MPDARPRPLPALPHRMTRCECADLSFAQVRRRIEESRLTIEDALRREGCGQTCTACLPDLIEYLRGAVAR